ncbi:MAG: YybH family protein [Candidatus Saccharicenans sp.]|uniref:YybH family protein n=1 Tax=Candidatus Saccharicenans sp. TaxID=2819258 RepID=UPI00404A5F28
MKKYFLVILIFWLCSLICYGAMNQAEQEILQVLESQKKAWNKGDLEGYMAYYWKSDELTFQSGANRVRGWDTLLERYKKSYSGEKMGRLDFSDIEVNVLGQDYAYVLGRWSVTVQDEKKCGVFTIILKRFPEGWRIIHDHTS